MPPRRGQGHQGYYDEPQGGRGGRGRGGGDEGAARGGAYGGRGGRARGGGDEGAGGSGYGGRGGYRGGGAPRGGGARGGWQGGRGGEAASSQDWRVEQRQPSYGAEQGSGGRGGEQRQSSYVAEHAGRYGSGSYGGRGGGGPHGVGRGAASASYSEGGSSGGGWGGGRGRSGGGRGRGRHDAEASSSGSGHSDHSRRGFEGSWASPAPPITELLPGLSLEDTEPPTPLDGAHGLLPVEASSEPAARDQEESWPATSKTTLVAAKRPSKGTIGTVVTVRANHFCVEVRGVATICQYDVEFSPKITSKAIARRLQRHLISAYKAEFGEKLPAYDGSKSLYSVGPLPFENREFSIVLPDERVEKKFTIAVRHVATFNIQNLEDFLKGRAAATPQEILQALDVAFREFPMLHYSPVSRSFYSKALGSAALEGGLAAWNGFYQSLRATEQGLALNVDISATAFYESVPVIEFLSKKLRQFSPHSHLSDANRVLVRKALAKLKIEVVHRQTSRKYRISGLSPVATKDLKFQLNGGGEISIVDYFRNTYNYDIRYVELPCVQVQGGKTSYLPMEVCKICDGQKYNGKLNENQTKGVLNLACAKPADRERVLKQILARDDGPGSGNFVTSFGMRVSREPTTVRARLLSPPKLMYGEQSHIRVVDPKYGSWNMQSSCVVEGGRLDLWAIISFDSRMHVNLAYDFGYALSQRCGELGISMAPEPVVKPYMFRKEDLEGPRLEKALRAVWDGACQVIRNSNQAGRLQLLICVMHEKHSAYGDLKRICETQIGIVTQCCLSINLFRKLNNSQYLANVAFKVNAKIGGRNTSLAVDLPHLCHRAFNRPAIIFGADVTHPNPGDDSSPSISAVVANTDWPSVTKFAARVDAQAHREEIIVNLKKMVQDLWREFCEKTRCRPERVIMFRDGVSEGQFDKVLQREVVAMKQALSEVGGLDYKPLITWVVVQKRHHTRLFPADNFKDKSSNVVPGTVVDHTITHPREFDFYLCSHAGIQGTSKPTHYHVLWDEINFSSDELQSLINNLCYTYARCTRSVSVVPPAYYAHLAAYRARLYLEGQGGSDTTSQRGGQSDSVASSGRISRAVAPVRTLPQILKNVQDVMYYC